MASKPGPRSRFVRLYETLDDRGKQVMQMVVEDRETPARIAAMALTDLAARRGIGPISAQTVKEARLGTLVGSVGLW